MDIVWEDKRANFAKARDLLNRADLPKGALVALPEMFATGFSMNAQEIAEHPGGETERFAQEAAQEFSLYLLAGTTTRMKEGKPHNQSVIFSPTGAEVGRYSKIFSFAPGGEADAYAGGAAIRLFEWEGFTVAPFICYDLRFPEIFRCAVAAGAHLIVVVASWPHTRASHWMTLLQARAIENQAYVVGVNRCGEDPKFCYPGRSLIIHPSGKILADAEAGEGVIQAECSLAELLEYRERLPFLRDMRPEWLPQKR
jgi:predicted amidohydrolase